MILLETTCFSLVFVRCMFWVCIGFLSNVRRKHFVVNIGLQTTTVDSLAKLLCVQIHSRATGIRLVSNARPMFVTSRRISTDADIRVSNFSCVHHEYAWFWFFFFFILWEIRSAPVLNSTGREEVERMEIYHEEYKFESCRVWRKGEGCSVATGYRSWRTYMDGFRSNRSISFSRSFSCFSSAVFRFTFGTVSVRTGSNRNSLCNSARFAFSPCRQKRIYV